MTDPPIPHAPSSALAPHRHNEYLKQLGLFATVFTQTEAHLFICLILTAGISLPIGRAVFSGTRAKDAISFMRRIFTVQQLQKNLVKIMEPCFEQIFIINDPRNHLMHYGVQFSKVELQSSNYVRVLSIEKEISYSMSLILLNNMSTDLNNVNFALMYCINVLNHRDPGVVP